MPRLSRRAFLAAGGVCVGGAALYRADGGRNLFYDLITEAVAGDQIDAATAHARARDGDIVLIDIRRPDEWAATGSAGGSLRLDMRRPDFVAALNDIAPDRSTPIALICARGVRSARLTNILTTEGYTRIIDVPEGMLGSTAGPGWIARALPLDKS